MFCEQVYYALGSGIVEKPFEILCGLSSKLFASGEEVALIGSKGGI